jgi:hypothetical protein
LREKRSNWIGHVLNNTLEALRAYRSPRNIRESQNIVERVAISE